MGSSSVDLSASNPLVLVRTRGYGTLPYCADDIGRVTPTAGQQGTANQIVSKRRRSSMSLAFLVHHGTDLENHKLACNPANRMVQTTAFRQPASARV